MKTGCEIKMIETQSDVIRGGVLLKNITLQWVKLVWFLYIGKNWYFFIYWHNGYKLVNQYLELLAFKR